MPISSFRLAQRWLPAILWAAVILFVSSISNPYAAVPDSVTIPNESIGRISHVAEYAILALLVSRASYEPDRALQPVAAQTGVGCFIFGILDECYQSQVPERTFQLQDLGLDLLGILLGVMLFALIKSR